MTEQAPDYHPPPASGEGAAPAVCPVCDAPVWHRPLWPGDRTRCLEYLREQIGTLQGEVLALRQELAARPRTDYDLRCFDCGAPHWFDTSIPSALWNQIAPEGGVLCLLCIDRRLEQAGLSCEAEFYYNGTALRSKLYAESQGEVQRLERELAQARQPIRTYTQLSAAPLIPVARLQALGVFDKDEPPVAPLGARHDTASWGPHRMPQTQAEAAIADAAQWPDAPLGTPQPGEP